MRSVEEMCKQYLFSNGWKSTNNFFTNHKIPEVVIFVNSEKIEHLTEEEEIITVNHQRGASINYLKKLHHTFNRVTFGRGKLPKIN